MLVFGHIAIEILILVEFHIHDIPLPFLHTFLLLAEGAKQVFHQSPIEKSSVFIHPCHLKIGKISHLGQWLQCSGDNLLVLVEIQEYVKFVTYSASIRHIARRQQYLSLDTSVEIHSEVHLLHYFQVVVVS